MNKGLPYIAENIDITTLIQHFHHGFEENVGSFTMVDRIYMVICEHKQSFGVAGFMQIPGIRAWLPLKNGKESGLDAMITVNIPIENLLNQLKPDISKIDIITIQIKPSTSIPGFFDVAILKDETY
jgi:hypothetical protein